MGRRQRQMIASILGVDEETAARALGEGMDISQFQQQKAEEKNLNDVVTFQERTVKAIEDLGRDLAPKIQELTETLLGYTRNFADWAPKMLVAIGASAVLGGVAKGGLALSKGLATGTIAAGTAGATAATGALSTLRAVPLIGQAVGGLAMGAMEYQKSGSAGRAAAVGGSALAGGLAGAASGAALGAFGGPVGMAIGGIIGGLVGQFGGAKMASTIMGETAKKPLDKSPVGQEMRRAQAEIRNPRKDTTIEVKEMTLPIRMVVDGREFSPIVEKAMNVKLAPQRPK